MVSYEIVIGVIIATIALAAGSLNLQAIIRLQEEMWLVVGFFPLFIMFFICALAETNRHPFDLPEAESELVSGYNVEYSGMSFALFSLGEYSNMLLMSALNSILFFGGWLPFSIFFIPDFYAFGLKICFFVLLFIFMRAALPRYRYDQLMNLGWKVFLPISIAYYLLIALIMLLFNGQAV
jgi:NADH-quinone oxidoreductase subunit H